MTKTYDIEKLKISKKNMISTKSRHQTLKITKTQYVNKNNNNKTVNKTIYQKKTPRFQNTKDTNNRSARYHQKIKMSGTSR